MSDPMAELAERFKTEVAERLGEVERLLVLADQIPLVPQAPSSQPIAPPAR